eukprot:TRINITY_DN2840_c1_g2::TRINITY_DN2840_c1_g2_i1::g.6132::m.6132 TRINITY_DN2840_c1_g2::TRINITY_DN2840_c1_g2_i1::g.6132  ORF type:complete len:2077 (-),score=567.85,sp/Q86WI1/PKHL1_HUMAN/31.35/0.0,sp/Q86WI1/PKHL1_HUMAN/29.80/3e-30,G8/PF10162.4/8.7e-26,Beta_helix/PF13229.1/3.9,Beta_helix/PF13229.1/2.6,Beta_helix/PF13229.1/0.35,DUF1049/PF06305.6/0.19 TRINITY_DN2840_c1_g2_i1:1087-7215(-)
MGHAFFVEDGIETSNKFIHNLGMKTRASMSLLNSDQTPATFWITHPNNYYYNNTAAGSEAFGFWYELFEHPTGPSATTTVCPRQELFGAFEGNTAHSNQENGIRIWEDYTPTARPCVAGAQPAVATFVNVTVYANKINGIEVTNGGHLRWVGIRTADNGANGVEITKVLGNSTWEQAYLEDALFIARSTANKLYHSGDYSGFGFKAPQTMFFTGRDLTFVGYTETMHAALRGCSWCKEFQGGMETRFENIKFYNTSNRAAFKWEHEVLFHDLDGSLSGVSDGWLMPTNGLLPPSDCHEDDLYSQGTEIPRGRFFLGPISPLSAVTSGGSSFGVNGSVCGSAFRYRRYSWNAVAPDFFTGRGFAISNVHGTTLIPWRHYRLTHMDGYMTTLPTLHEYEWHFVTEDYNRLDPISWSGVLYQMLPDDWLVTHMEFLQRADHFHIKNIIAPVENELFPPLTAEDASYTFNNSTEFYPDNFWEFGNDTYVLSTLRTGNGTSGTSLQPTDLSWNFLMHLCPEPGCPQPPVPGYEEKYLRWCNASSWPNNTIPRDGENVTINPGWTMLLDCSTARLNMLTIYGTLIFEDTQDLNLSAVYIFVQGGNLTIGNETQPFSHKARVRLYGSRNTPNHALTNELNLGSKSLGIFGNVKMFGVPVARMSTALDTFAFKGQRTIHVKDNVLAAGWKVGDMIVLAPTGYEAWHTETFNISGISSDGRTLTLDAAITYDRAYESVRVGNDTLVIAAEVGLLTRNVVVEGVDGGLSEWSGSLTTQQFGCMVVVSAFTDVDSGIEYTGSFRADSIEWSNCGQRGWSDLIDPRFSLSFRDLYAGVAEDGDVANYMRRSAMHHSYNTNLGVLGCLGVEISDNVFHRSFDNQIVVSGYANVLKRNLAIGTFVESPDQLDSHSLQFPATYYIMGESNIVQNNIAAGSQFAAFKVLGDSCDIPDSAALMVNNLAHSAVFGLQILGNGQECAAVRGFTAYRCWTSGIFAGDKLSACPSSLYLKNLRLINNRLGISASILGPNSVYHVRTDKFVRVENAVIVGYSPNDTCGDMQNTAPAYDPVAPPGAFYRQAISLPTFGAGQIRWYLPMFYPTISAGVYTNNVTFAHFVPTPCSGQSATALFASNPKSADAMHPMFMSNTTLLNVSVDVIAYMFDPDPDWVNLADCIDMDCDGPKHVIIVDTDGSLLGNGSGASIVPFAELRFNETRIPNAMVTNTDGTRIPYSDVVFGKGIIKGAAQKATDVKCWWMDSWNAYSCRDLDHRMLVVESLDADAETRRLSPIALGSEGWVDLINGPMDHGWCSFFTCQKRLSTFFTVVAPGHNYTWYYTSTAPKMTRFHLLHANETQGVQLAVFFTTPNRLDVYRNGIYIEPMNAQYSKPDDENGQALMWQGEQYIPTLAAIPGANYYHRDTQTLYLIVKGTDSVDIVTSSVVQVGLGLAIPIEDFYQQDMDDFIASLAFILDIDMSMIKIVNVVAEDSALSSRRQHGAGHSNAHARGPLASSSGVSLSLEIGNPPSETAPEVYTPSANFTTSDAGGSTDGVGNTTSPSGQAQVAQYSAQMEVYTSSVQECSYLNGIAEKLVASTQTGALAAALNTTVRGLQVVLATPAASPPVIPDALLDPAVVNSTEAPNIIVINDTTTTTTTPPVYFQIPSDMRMLSHPSLQVVVGTPFYGGLLDVVDSNSDRVLNLGIGDSTWHAVASINWTLVDTRSEYSLQNYDVEFVNGTANFTSMAIKRMSGGGGGGHSSDSRAGGSRDPAVMSVTLTFTTTSGGMEVRSQDITVIDYYDAEPTTAPETAPSSESSASQPESHLETQPYTVSDDSQAESSSSSAPLSALGAGLLAGGIVIAVLIAVNVHMYHRRRNAGLKTHTIMVEQWSGNFAGLKRSISSRLPTFFSPAGGGSGGHDHEGPAPVKSAPGARPPSAPASDPFGFHDTHPAPPGMLNEGGMGMSALVEGDVLAGEAGRPARTNKLDTHHADKDFDSPASDKDLGEFHPSRNVMDPRVARPANWFKIDQRKDSERDELILARSQSNRNVIALNKAPPLRR